MSPTSADLLRLLTPAAGGFPPAQGLSRAQLEGADFATLLQRARQGELDSGRPVTIATNANVKLTPDQVQRLSAAADKAEAEGATRALVLMDGIALRLDVSTRQITGPANLSGPGVLTGIDSVINLPPVTDAAAPAPLPSATGLGSPSLLRALSRGVGNP